MYAKNAVKIALSMTIYVSLLTIGTLSFAESDVMSQLDSLTNSLGITTSSSSQTYNHTNADGTTSLGRQALNNLRKEGYTDAEIKEALNKVGLDADAYFNTENKNNQQYTSNYGISAQGQQILDNLKKEGYSDSEIRKALEKVGLDADIYLNGETKNNQKSQNQYNSAYSSRSCKVYNIEYISLLDAYTSPNLKNKEYFVNQDYFKRYIDSKNPQKDGCPTNIGRISTSYQDNSNSNDQYIAPNGKVYFIQQENGGFTSNELNNIRYFNSITELKYYIRDRNPLIGM